MSLQYKSSYNLLLCRGNYIIELKNWQYLVACFRGDLKFETFCLPRLVCCLLPQAAHEKQGKMSFCEDTSRSGKGPAAPCNPAWVTLLSHHDGVILGYG